MIISLIFSEHGIMQLFQMKNWLKQLVVLQLSYAGYLLKAKKRMAINWETMQSYHDRVSISTPIESVKDVKETYQKIDNHLHCMSEYEPRLLDNKLLDIGVPEGRKMRYLWFKELKLSHRLQFFCVLLMFWDNFFKLIGWLKTFPALVYLLISGRSYFWLNQ